MPNKKTSKKDAKDAKVLPFDLSRLIPHDGRSLADSLGKSPLAIDPSLWVESSALRELLAPTNDLTDLLSDQEMRKRYREGRYRPGENTMLRIPYYPPCISITATHIAKKCEPKPPGVAVVLSLALHIGMLHIDRWDSLRRISNAVDAFYLTSPDLSPGAISGFKATRDNLQPLPLNAGYINLVISDTREKELSALTSKTCLPSNGRMAAYCIMLTLSRQPEKYVNSQFRQEMECKTRELWQWMGWKAGRMETVVKEFGVFTADKSF